MILPSVLLRTVLRSRPPVTRCRRSVVTTWCMTGLKVWLSVCTGTYARGRPDSQTPLTRQTQKTDWYVWGSKTFQLKLSVAARRERRDQVCSETNWGIVCNQISVKSAVHSDHLHPKSSTHYSPVNTHCSLCVASRKKACFILPGNGKKKDLNNCMMMTTQSSSWVLNNHQW